jgi:nitroreductase
MFEHPAPNRYPIHELMRLRFSGRSFDPKPVETEKILSILEAACWAPSSSNEQPWAFVVGVKGEKDGWDAILGSLMEANRAWARMAPVMVLACARKSYARGGQPNAHSWYDLGAACENLHLEAVAQGLRTHPMGGFDPNKARESLGLPKDVDPVAVIAMGYAAPPDELMEPYKERETAPRKRKPFEESVYFSKWGGRPG